LYSHQRSATPRIVVFSFLFTWWPEWPVESFLRDIRSPDLALHELVEIDQHPEHD
jgi:hypothetical protein